MNKKTNYIIIFALLLGLTMGIVISDYAKQLGTILANANIPNPGHSLSEIEGSETLVRTLGDQIIGGTKSFSSPVVVASPTDNNHAATKYYVDNLPALGLPDGGQPGDTLVMGIAGPLWNSPLTWDPDSARRKTAFDCGQIGGTVYDTGGGKTICRYPGSTVLEGWRQAENWQQYSLAEWGGDHCGNHKSTGPTSFSDIRSVEKYSLGIFGGYCLGSQGYSTFTCGNCWVSYNPGNYPYNHWFVGVSYNTSSNRVTIGIY